MGEFYSEMAGVTRELLAPTSEGGLGQGSIVLVRFIPAAEPSNPWDPPAEPTPVRTVLDGAATGVSKELLGTPLANGTAILASDKSVIVSVWPGDAEPEDILELDGAAHTIMRVDRIPPVGITAAVRLIVRG